MLTKNPGDVDRRPDKPLYGLFSFPEAAGYVVPKGVYLLRGGPLGLQLVLVKALLEYPAQAWHALHPVEQGWVLCRVLIALQTSTQTI